MLIAAMSFGMLRSLSHSLQLLSPAFGQLLCPSPHFVHFFLHSAPFHHVRSYTFATRHGITLPTHKSLSPVLHIPFRKANTRLTWLHYASLRHSFTSVGISPPAAYYFARLACLLWLRVCHAFCSVHTIPTQQQKVTPNPCVNVAVQRTVVLSCPAPSQALAGTSSHASFPCLSRLASLLCSSAGYSPAQLCFFWPQALFPFPSNIIFRGIKK